MKLNKILIALAFLLICHPKQVAAQQVGFTYQAVALDQSKAQGFGKDSRGEILVNKPISLRFSIREGTEDGEIKYQEIHHTSTDIFGIFRLVIGRGLNATGSPLQDLQWGELAYFLQVEIDLGNGFELMGIEELLGVPYALNTGKQLLSLEQNELSISNGNSVILSDNDPTNELISSLSIDGTNLQISDAGGTKSVDLKDLAGGTRNEAEVDAFVSNNGYLTSETQDLQLIGNILSLTNINGGTQIDLSPYLDDTNLSESEVDAYVSNNGYLTSEIQNLQLIGNMLSITNNNAATQIDLTPYRNIFERTNTIVSNENGDYATDDFVFGSPQLNNDGNAAHQRRMFFDKSAGSFRAGRASATQWDAGNVGGFSTALGDDNIASGFGTTAVGSLNTASGINAIAMGGENTATGNYTVAQGYSNLAQGINSVANGTLNQAIGAYSNSVGYQNVASGLGSISIGHYLNATNEESISIGNNSTASGYSSITLGTSNIASNLYAISIGVSNESTGHGSISIGSGDQTSGDYASAVGFGLKAKSFGETVLGYYNTDYTPLGGSSHQTLNLQDRLFVIGNGTPEWLLPGGVIPIPSDALVMLKNGNTRLHGQLTIDADNVNGAGQSYTLPGQDGTTNQTLVTDGNGSVTWANVNDADASITNEIQDLSLANNVLSITNNTAATPISLTPYLDAAFRTTSNVTSNAPGNYASDDFVFGSPQLEDDGDAQHDTRFFFDKSKGALRSGSAESDHWNDTNRGTNSTAFGTNNVAPGNHSFAAGLQNMAHDASTVAIGTYNQALGYNSIAIGRNAIASGLHSMAFGVYTQARSFGETALGIFATDYMPADIEAWNGADRLLNIGNGIAGAPSDAFTIFKNGNATLLGVLTDASDIRLKKEIHPLTFSMSRLSLMKGVNYKWNGVKPQDTVSLQTGFIAQEVEKLFPELVLTDSHGYKSVNYIGLIPHLVEAVKELKKENEQLKIENTMTRKTAAVQFESLEARLRLLEKLVDQMTSSAQGKN